MKKFIVTIVVVVALYLNITSQTVTGRLINQFGAGIPNAELMLYIHPNEYSTSSASDGSFIFSGITSVDEEEQLPEGYRISNNFPNPFNPETRIIITLPQTSKVKVDVYNVIGQVVLDKPAEILSAGTNQIDLKLDGLSNGIYLARITIDDKYTVMRKLSLVYGSQHLLKIGPSTSSFLPKNNKSSFVTIDSLVVTGTNVVKTSFINLPPYTGSNLDLGTLTANIEMVLSEQTVIADSSTLDNIITFDSTSITFSGDAAQIHSLNIGSILILGIDDGYIKKVNSIQEQGDNIIVTTENAKLDEVITEGEIDFRGVFDISNMKIIDGTGKLIMFDQTTGLINIEFAGINFGFGSALDIHAGTAFPSPEFIFNIKFRFGIQNAEFGLTVNNETFLEIVTFGSVHGGGRYSPEWATITFLPGIPTGIPGLNIIPRIRIGLDASISIEQESQNRFDVSSTMTTGFLYANNSFNGYFDVEKNFTSSSNISDFTDINGSISIPRIEFYLNGKAGVFFELAAGGKFRVAEDNQGVYRGIYGSIGINGGVGIDVFGFNLSYTENIYEQEWELSKEYLSGPNQPPNQPSNPNPVDGAINQSINPSLSWDCSDPDGDPLTYDIYFGTDSNPPLVKSDNSTSTYNPGALNYNTDYYWKVRAKDNHSNSTNSPIWSFTTESGGTAPEAPTLVSPVNNSTDQSTSPVLSWNASTGSDNYKLQVSTNNSFNSYVYNQSGLTNTNQQISGLENSTTYYWRVNATNTYGTSDWSEIWNFTTTSGGDMGEPCPGIPTVTYEGKTYNTVQIGDQCWLRENLNVGTMITNNSGGFLQTDNGIIEKYCYGNNPANCATYGGLYEWPEAMQYIIQEKAQGICPDGWHIPTFAEFLTLKDFVNDQAAALTDESETLYYTPTVTQNETGFSALFAGGRNNYGNFYSLGYVTYFWSSGEYSSYGALFVFLGYSSSNVHFASSYKDYGFSVRCVQD